jgi:quinoprotein glucose dehydrogenase
MLRKTVACLLVLSGVGNAQADVFWPSYGGDALGSKYSPLTQINTENVAQLRRAWVHHTEDVSDGTKGGAKTTYEATPIMVDDALYVCSPFNRVFSVDPATGAQKWVFDPKIDRSISLEGALKCRGVAYWESADVSSNRRCQKRILSGAIDGRLFAIDAESGTLCEDFGNNGTVQVNDFPNEGKHRLDLISAPAIYKNLVIVGSSIGDNSFANMVNGMVYALDVETGELVWSFNPIPEDLQSSTGAANTWAPISVDEKRGLVVIGTGSASPDYYGASRTDPIEYANATVALDANTGEPVWHFQTVHHDIWDYDIPSQPALVTMEIDGQPKEVVLQTTKTGFLFVFDRDTGEPIYEVVEVPVPQSNVPGEKTSPTQPIPVLPKAFARQRITPDDAWGLVLIDKWQCRKKFEALQNEGMFTPISTEGSMQYPSFAGGGNWGGLAYDPETNVAVVNAMNLAASMQLLSTGEVDTPEKKSAHSDAGYELEPTRDAQYSMKRGIIMSMFGAPCSPPPWGTLNAINVSTGETLWEVPFGRVKKGPFKTLARWGAPNIGGPIITAGGLIFIGATLDNEFHAYDLKTGKQVWYDDLPAPANATPMTYEYQGKQYVVVAAGGHGVFDTDLSDALIAYTLDGAKQ